MIDYQVPVSSEVFALDAAFWKRFAEECWDRSARVFTQVFESPIASEEDFLRQLAMQLENAGESLVLELDERQANARGFARERKHLPEDGDDLATYLRRIETLSNSNSSMLYSSRIQLRLPEIYFRVRAFCRGLYEAVGFPGGSLDLDFFAGDYRHASRGVHRDGASFSFILSGRKRMLVWPFEALAHEVPDTPGQRATGSGRYFLSHVDWQKYRDSAIVLEGGPGDMMFWPASFWHMPEGDGEPVLTLNVSPFPYGEVGFTPLLSELAKRIMGGDTKVPLPFDYPSSSGTDLGSCAPPQKLFRLAEDLQRLVEESLAELCDSDRLHELWYKRHSAAFIEPPDPLPKETPLPAPTEQLSGHPHSRIIYGQRDGKLEVYSNGYRFRWAMQTEAGIALAQRTASCEPFSISEISASRSKEQEESTYSKELSMLLHFLIRSRGVFKR